MQVIDEITREHTGLRLHRPARSAATTPRPCGSGTRRSWPGATQVLELGFDDTFMRMWHFYLEYSRAGFASGYIDVNQLTFTKESSR